MAKETLQGILCVIGATLIHLTYGYFYTIGNMIPYISSYLKESGNEVFLSAAVLAVQGVIMPFGGFLSNKVGFRITAIISCFIESSGVILTYWTINAGFVPVIFTYSIMLALGFALAYSVVLQLAIGWFPEKRGVVVGIIVGGFGAGALIFTPIQLAYVNPNNFKINTTTGYFDQPELLERIPSVFLLCGGIMLGLQIIGCILLRKKPEKPEPEIGELNKLCIEKPLKVKQILTDGRFYVLWFMMLTMTIPITLIASLYKKFGQTLINDDYYLTAVATVSSIFNAGGRITWGLIVDKVSFKLAIYIMLSIWAFSQATFPFLTYSNDITAKVLFLIWVCLLFFSFCGTFVLMPTAVSKIFGRVNLSVVYGFLFSAFSFGSILCAVLSKYLVNKWFTLFFFGASINVVGAILVTLLPDKDMSKKLNICLPLTDRIWGPECRPQDDEKMLDGEEAEPLNKTSSA